MELPKRKSIRLKEYDYSSNGAYFVTICTHQKQCILWGDVGNGLDHSANLPLTPIGEIAQKDMEDISKHFPYVQVEKYVIMPNHIHAIIMINKNEDMAEWSRPFPTLSAIIGLYKSGVSRKVGSSIWQKSFHEHIIRNQTSYDEIWQYIDTNPMKWELDQYYKAAL
ncbi:transposase [Chakrabartyella piscis]|uniref:transposase n=1 Tax=Chakrabartyella piscis TaxID=2918914 RepID=UPI002958472B|nr:transposase [Chakrabartyella piscis]